MLVRQILSSKPSLPIVTVQADAKVSEAARLLAEKRIGAVIVSADGASVDGILSERDIVRELGKRGGGCLDDAVSSLMTNAVIACHPGDSVLSVLEKMTDGRFRHMPVMDGDEMVGLISIGDVVKARLSELSMEKDALQGMIKGF